MVDPNRAERTGKKSPWPKGRPRHGLTDQQLAEWQKLKRRVERICRSPGRSTDRVRPSRRGLAEYVGVDSKTVTRWISGDRTPNAKHLAAIAKWEHELRSR